MNVNRKYLNGVLVEFTINGLPQPIDGSAAVLAQPSRWPLVMLPLKLLAKSTDKGAGDIIAREVGPLGGDAFKKWYKLIFGRECGCNTRQESWNTRYPLEQI